MNRLFEQFVAGFLRYHRENALPLKFQNYDIIVQGQGETRWLARTRPQENQGHPVFRLKPDLLLRSSNRKIDLIIDTKYKTQERINDADAYQMYAYASRYDCPEVLLLYPKGQMGSQKLYTYHPAALTLTCLRTQTISLRHNLSIQTGRNNLANELAQALNGW